MTTLITGVFWESGSFLQKILFLIGAIFMTIRAFIDKVIMFKVLECVIIIGSILAFIDMSNINKYIIMGISIFISFFYLIKIKLYKNDKFMFLGAIGLVSLALGFATNPLQYGLIFNIFLALGAIFLTFYSILHYIKNKVSISILFMILNGIFAIKPILYIINKI